MSRKFEIEWPDFGVVVSVDLLDDENPELCEEFWQGLPFQTIFAGSMSAGEMLKIPVPFPMNLAPKEKLVFFPEQPPGTVVSMGWGGLLLKYGTVVEPFRLPRIAKVPGKLDMIIASNIFLICARLKLGSIAKLMILPI